MPVSQDIFHKQICPLGVCWDCCELALSLRPGRPHREARVLSYCEGAAVFSMTIQRVLYRNGYIYWLISISLHSNFY